VQILKRIEKSRKCCISRTWTLALDALGILPAKGLNLKQRSFITKTLKIGNERDGLNIFSGKYKFNINFVRIEEKQFFFFVHKLYSRTNSTKVSALIDY